MDILTLPHQIIDLTSDFTCQKAWRAHFSSKNQSHTCNICGTCRRLAESSGLSVHIAQKQKNIPPDRLELSTSRSHISGQLGLIRAMITVVRASQLRHGGFGTHLEMRVVNWYDWVNHDRKAFGSIYNSCDYGFRLQPPLSALQSCIQCHSMVLDNTITKHRIPGV